MIWLNDGRCWMIDVDELMMEVGWRKIPSGRRNVLTCWKQVRKERWETLGSLKDYERKP
jgi:hypothetical protein